MEPETRHSAYWYPDDATRQARVGVLEALRRYRSSESEMRVRMQRSMAMGENEMLVLRYLARAAAEEHPVTPIDLARHLHFSTASITALLDRLERSGHVVRSPHPTDRRKVVISNTAHAHAEMRATLGHMHARMHAATDGLGPTEAAVIIDFLDRMRLAVDQVDERTTVDPARPAAGPTALAS